MDHLVKMSEPSNKFVTHWTYKGEFVRREPITETSPERDWKLSNTGLDTSTKPVKKTRKKTIKTREKDSIKPAVPEWKR